MISIGKPAGTLGLALTLKNSRLIFAGPHQVPFWLSNEPAPLRRYMQLLR